MPSDAVPSDAGPFDAVLFDMDGLLVDTEPVWLQVESALVAELGGTWSEEHQRTIMGSSLDHASRYIRDLTGTQLPADEVGRRLTDGMLARLADAPIPIQAGAVELVTEVAHSGVPYGLVSASVRPIVDLIVAALGRAGMPGFPVSVAGDEVAHSKPDPDPYLRAAELLGIDVTRAVVLEDSPNGVRAGWAAGATVVAIPHAIAISPRERVIVRPSLVGLDLRELGRLVATPGAG